MIVVADERKQVDVLGKFHLPVEVLQFEWEATRGLLSALCPGTVSIRGASDHSSPTTGVHTRLQFWRIDYQPKVTGVRDPFDSGGRRSRPFLRHVRGLS